MKAVSQSSGLATPSPVKASFLSECVRVRLAQLVPLKTTLPSTKDSPKYQQILASVREVGLIEPPAIFPIPDRPGYFHILDGHLRVDALRELELVDVDCMLATAEDTYTYNRRVARLGAMQEHRMVMRAWERGVSPQRIADALGLGPESVKSRFKLLTGICKEAVALLANTPCPAAVFPLLRKMNPIRQMEAVELMVGQHNFSAKFVQAILSATPKSDRQQEPRARKSHASANSMARLQREIARLKTQTNAAEMDHGPDILKLTIARTYLTSLLANREVADWLSLNRPDYVKEFRRIGGQQDTETELRLVAPDEQRSNTRVSDSC